MNSISLLHALLSVTLAAGLGFAPDEPNELTFPAQEAKFVRLVILAHRGGQPCLDELEVYAPEGQENLALTSKDAKANRFVMSARLPNPQDRTPQRWTLWQRLQLDRCDRKG